MHTRSGRWATTWCDEGENDTMRASTKCGHRHRRPSSVVCVQGKRVGARGLTYESRGPAVDVTLWWSCAYFTSCRQIGRYCRGNYRNQTRRDAAIPSTRARYMTYHCTTQRRAAITGAYTGAGSKPKSRRDSQRRHQPVRTIRNLSYPDQQRGSPPAHTREHSRRSPRTRAPEQAR